MKKAIKRFSLILLLSYIPVQVNAKDLVNNKQLSFPIIERELNESDFSEKTDILAGSLNLEIQPENNSLKGEIKYLLKNTAHSGLNKILFVLNSGLKINKINLEGAEIKELIKEKTSEGEPVAYVIYLNKPGTINQNIKMEIEYQGSIISNYKFGRILDNDVFLSSKSFFYPRLEKLEQKTSDFELKISVPDNYTVISQSDNFHKENKNGKKIFRSKLKHYNGIDNENGLYLSAARYKEYKKENINIFYLESDNQQLEYIADFEKKSLKSLSEVFGKHKSQRFNIVQVNRDDLGGMATVNTIFLSGKHFLISKNDPQYTYFKKAFEDEKKIMDEYRYYLRNVLAHESVHLFFNNVYDYDKAWFIGGRFSELRLLSVCLYSLNFLLRSFFSPLSSRIFREINSGKPSANQALS